MKHFRKTLPLFIIFGLLFLWLYACHEARDQQPQQVQTQPSNPVVIEDSKILVGGKEIKWEQKFCPVCGKPLYKYYEKDGIKIRIEYDHHQCDR